MVWVEAVASVGAVATVTWATLAASATMAGTPEIESDMPL